uniref:C2H2-type domain-containing protein n=1 Tax=Peronospora matthiolae TaxID=2874970 RepID=A0AAV1TVV7_9STRA
MDIRPATSAPALASTSLPSFVSCSRDCNVPATSGALSALYKESHRASPGPFHAPSFKTEANCATSPASGTADSWPLPMSSWLTASLMPRQLVPVTCAMPRMDDGSPTSSAIELDRFSGFGAEPVETDVGSRSCRYSYGFSAAALTGAMEPETKLHCGACTTMGAALEAIPSSRVPAVITSLTPAAPSRKRKRIPGAMRLRKFLCTYPGCGKSFKDSTRLRDHTVVHFRVQTGEQPYVCRVPGCSKRYSSCAALPSHRSSHASEQSLTAQQIRGESVRAAVDANAPQLQETRMSPFGCLECGKRFHVRELLMAHLEIHAAYRAAALATMPATGNATNESRRGGDEAGALQWHGYGIESLPSVVGTPSFNESREYQATIRAQQSQIELLEAEVVRLRKQLSTVPAATSAPPAIVISDQLAVTPPVAMLYDGCKPFECGICHNRFTNFCQLTFHGKHHPQSPMTEVVGKQV